MGEGGGQVLRSALTLSHSGDRFDVRMFPPPPCATQISARWPGTVLLVLARFESTQVCYAALGARGKPAERVADEAVLALRHFLRTDAAVDAYVADQLRLPLAFVPGRSAFHTAEITRHLVTNAQVIYAFVPAVIDIQGKIGQPGQVVLDGVEAARCDSRH